MRRTRIFAFILVICMVGAIFAGCSQATTTTTAAGTTEGTTTATTTGTTAGTTAEKRIVLGYASIDDSLEHTIPVRENIKKVAAEMGVDVICVDNALDGQKALSNADSLILQGIDCLIEFNLDVSVNPAIKEKCDAAGIPVIGIDLPVPNSPTFGADNVESGRIVGRALGSLAKENWESQVDLVFLLSVPGGGEAVTTRMDNILVGIKEKCPNLDESKVVVGDTKNDAMVSQQLTADVLTANPNSKHILIGCIDDTSAQAAFAAVQAANRESDVFIVNHGCSVQTRENLYEQKRTGKLNCWRGGVSYFLERYGEYVVPAAIKLAKGEKVPDKINMEHEFVDVNNIEDLYPEAIWGQG